MNPRDFQASADDLLGSVRESDWRSATSRAYYASFHVSIQVLRACGFHPLSGDRIHAYIWMRLSNCGHSDLEQVGRNLAALRRQRNTADYNLALSFTHRVAADDVAAAEDIIRLLDEAVTLPHVLAQITQTMRDYERDTLREITWHA